MEANLAQLARGLVGRRARSGFMRSAQVRSKPSDAAFGDGLADRVCSLRSS